MKKKKGIKGMLKWIRQYRDSPKEIKIFTINWLIYGLVIIITTVYCYGRLDFVRSYHNTVPTTHTEGSPSMKK